MSKSLEMQMQAHQKLQELQKDDYKNDLPQ